MPDPGGVYRQAGLLTYASNSHTHSLPGFPVADLRPMCGLGAYSGGTVREFHPIIYSLFAAVSTGKALDGVSIDHFVVRVNPHYRIWGEGFLP